MEMPHLLTSTDETTFHIECNLHFDMSKRSFCVQADTMGEGATVGMIPCNSTKLSQLWFMDKFGQLRLKARDSRCLIWNDKGHLTMSSYCKSDIYEDFEGSPKYPFEFKMDKKAIVAVRENKNRALGVSKNNKYAAMKLFPMIGTNPSIYMFYLASVNYKPQSPTPSSLPSQSSAPSSFPSECINEPGWVVGGVDKLYAGLTCVDIASSDVENLCKKIESIPDSRYEFKRVRVNSFHFIFSRCRFLQL